MDAPYGEAFQAAPMVLEPQAQAVSETETTD